MTEHEWPTHLDGLIKRARFGPGEDFWKGAEAALRTESDETIHHLAVLGLTELVSQVHRIDRDRHEPCAGDELAMNFLRSIGADLDSLEDPEES